MVSNDTRKGTEKLLGENNNFGLDKDQISIVQQGSGVPALLDNNAKFSMDDATKNIITKPHGHGDIHELLYTSGVAKKWLDEKGINWMCFFQVCDWSVLVRGRRKGLTVGFAESFQFSICSVSGYKWTCFPHATSDAGSIERTEFSDEFAGCAKESKTSNWWYRQAK